jgi:hypothetical protein
LFVLCLKASPSTGHRGLPPHPISLLSCEYADIMPVQLRLRAIANEFILQRKVKLVTEQEILYVIISTS